LPYLLSTCPNCNGRGDIMGFGV